MEELTVIICRYGSRDCCVECCRNPEILTTRGKIGLCLIRARKAWTHFLMHSKEARGCANC